MKKFAKWMGAFVVLACLCMALVACGGETGKYKYSESMTEEGVTVSVSQVIELKKDNKVTMTSTYKMGGEEESDSVSGTYEVKDGKITITILDEDGEVDYTLTGTFKKGKSITIGEGDNAVTYKK